MRVLEVWAHNEKKIIIIIITKHSFSNKLKDFQQKKTKIKNEVFVLENKLHKGNNIFLYV